MKNPIKYFEVCKILWLKNAKKLFYNFNIVYKVYVCVTKQVVGILFLSQSSFGLAQDDCSLPLIF